MSIYKTLHTTDQPYEHPKADWRSAVFVVLYVAAIYGAALLLHRFAQ